MRSVRGTALLAWLSVACYTDGTAPADARRLPTTLRLVAEAHLVDAQGLRIDCGVETLVTLSDRVEGDGTRLVHYGAGGGEARRYRDLSAERSIAFWADTHFPDLEFHFIGFDSIEVRSPLSASATERFWHEFAVWAGNTRGATATRLAGGAWTCWPMDTPPTSGDYYDAEGVAIGTWSLEVDPP
jgi:hypothetical protein